MVIDYSSIIGNNQWLISWSLIDYPLITHWCHWCHWSSMRYAWTLETGNKSLVRSIIFSIIRENKNSKQKVGGVYINNNLDFDDCNHKYPELSVYWMILAGKLNMSKNLLSFKKMFILFLINPFPWFVLWLKTSTVSDCAAWLLLMRTRNYLLLNTWHENFDF